MPYTHDDDDFEADLDGREDPDTDDADWNMDPDVVACPHCRKEISEDAEWCPHCDTYVITQGTSESRKPLWVITGLVLIALVIIAWII